MFKTCKELFSTGPRRNFLVRWGSALVIAALEFQAICSLILELD